MPETDVYSQILSALEKLARLQPRVHGANYHDFQLRPPCSEEEVEAFEREQQIRLPEDYRQFLLRCGRGGAGPAYGIFQFYELDDGTWRRNSKWERLGSTLPGNLSDPFPYSEAWNEKPEIDPGLEKKDPEEFERQWSAFDEKYDGPVNGAIPICHTGCAHYEWLVVTGPEAGHIWIDDRVDARGFKPLTLPGLPRVTFLEWYRDWLNKALDAAGKQRLKEDTDEDKAVYARIVEDVHKLKRAKAKVPGSDMHEFKLYPTMPEYEIVGFEQDYGVRLPEEYRNFLKCCGRGGAGPSYGLFDFHMMDDGGYGFQYWEQGDGFVGTLAKPFAFTETWNDLTGRPEDELQDRDPAEFDRRIEKFEKKYWAPLDGAIPICHLGCCLREWLVVSGPEAGHVWADYRTDHEGIFPLTRNGSERVTFLQWYRNWLDEALETMKKEEEKKATAAVIPPEGGTTNRRSTSRRRKILFVSIILGAIALVVLAFVELALRGALAYKTRGNLNHITTAVNTDPKKVLGMGDIVLTDPNPLIVYKLKPGVRGIIHNVEISINSLGYRAPEPVKPASTEKAVRVVLLGDSFTYGWGVEQNEIYPAQLADALRAAAAPGKSIDVVNMGVPGYNSVQEVEAFVTRELQSRPAAVTIQYCLNDNILPLFLTRRNYLTDMRRLYLLDFAPTLRRLANPVAPDEGGLAQDLFKIYTPPRGPFELDPRQVPAEYMPLFGWDRMAEAYQKLKAECDKAGVPVWLVLPAETAWEHYKWGQNHPDSDPHCEKIINLCKQLGIPVIDTFPDVRRFVEARGWQSEDLMVVNDGHPNAMKHSIIAQRILSAIAPALEKEGAIDPAKVPAQLQALRENNERRAAQHQKLPAIKREPLKD